MSHILQQPMLTLSAETVDGIHNLDMNGLSAMWAVFTKCKMHLKDGHRLENMSWRLWFREKQAASSSCSRSTCSPTPQLAFSTPSGVLDSSSTVNTLVDSVNYSLDNETWSRGIAKNSTTAAASTSADTADQNNEYDSMFELDEDDGYDDDDEDVFGDDDEYSLCDSNGQLPPYDFTKKKPKPHENQPSLLSALFQKQPEQSSEKKKLPQPASGIPLPVTHHHQHYSGSCYLGPDVSRQHLMSKELSESLMRNVLWEHTLQQNSVYRKIKDLDGREEHQRQHSFTGSISSSWLENFHGW